MCIYMFLMNAKHSGIWDHSPSSMLTMQQQFDSGTKCRWLRGSLPSQGNGITLIQCDKKIVLPELWRFGPGHRNDLWSCWFRRRHFSQVLLSPEKNVIHNRSTCVFTFGNAFPKNNVNHFWELVGIPGIPSHSFNEANPYTSVVSIVLETGIACHFLAAGFFQSGHYFWPSFWPADGLMDCWHRSYGLGLI